MVTWRHISSKRIFILVILMITLIPSIAHAKLPDILSFNSYFELDYDKSLLNQDLKINKSINIPLTIKYTSDLSEEVYNKTKKIPLPFMLRNKILFNRSMIQQIVNINITNANEITWAHINLIQNKTYINELPLYNQAVIINTSLILSPFEEAPADKETIKLKISCEDLGILKGTEFEFDIPFKPRFTPLITITTEKSLQLATPGEPINYKINVTNHSNKRVRIDSEMITVDPKWYQTVNPQSLVVDPNDTNYFIFSAIAPNEFGWHDQRKEFKLNIHAQIFPIQTNDSLDRSYELILKAKHYGFSTPGFTILGVFATITLCFILKKINIYHKRSGK